MRGIRHCVRLALAALTCGLAIPALDRAAAYCLLDLRWESGTVTMTHNLPGSGLLTNGTSSWGENAESAMADWSNVTGGFTFFTGGAINAGQGADGLNNMVFADNVVGDPFAPDVLAVTFTRTDAGGTALESDVVFNVDVNWDAYDGPIRVDARRNVIFDFRRVALHELGHVLGLNHPDAACGQIVEAIMNGRTTDTDRLKVDDRNGISFLYADGNMPPVADAGENLTGSPADPFVLDASGSEDPDGSIVSYEWRVDGRPVGTGRVIEITVSPGTHVASLTVTDDQGAIGTDLTVITADFETVAADPDNRAPVADAGEDLTVPAGRIVTLDGSGSFDPDGSIDRYVWSEGSTVLGDQEQTRVAFSSGAHAVTLTVFDDGGAADSDVTSVVIAAEDGVDDGPLISVEPVPPTNLPAPAEPTTTPCGAVAWIPLLSGLLVCKATTRGRR